MAAHSPSSDRNRTSNNIFFPTDFNYRLQLDWLSTQWGEGGGGGLEGKK